MDCKGMTPFLLRRHSSGCRPSLLKRGHHRWAAGLVGQDLVNIVHDGVGQLRKKLKWPGRQKGQNAFRTNLSPGDCWGAWPCGPPCRRRARHTGWWRSWWPRPPPAGSETRPAAQQPEVRGKFSTLGYSSVLSEFLTYNFVSRYEILTQVRRKKKSHRLKLFYS